MEDTGQGVAEVANTGELVVLEFGKKHDDADVEGWLEEEGDLPFYLNPTLEGAESEWTTLDATADIIHWRRGAIAHAISSAAIYGDNSLEQFAGRMRVAYSTVLDWLATYRRVLNLHPARRARVLSLDLRFSHYRAANVIKDDVLYEQLLNRAAEEGWLVGRLAEAVQAWRAAFDENTGNYDDDATVVDQDGPETPASYQRDPNERARALLVGFMAWLRNSCGYEVFSLDDGEVGPAITNLPDLVDEYLDDEG